MIAMHKIAAREARARQGSGSIASGFVSGAGCLCASFGFLFCTAYHLPSMPLRTMNALLHHGDSAREIPLCLPLTVQTQSLASCCVRLILPAI